MHQPESELEIETHKILWDYNYKRITQFQPVDFALQAEYKVKIKESKTLDKYQDLARELKKLWNMRVTVTTHKGLEKRLGELEIRGKSGLSRSHDF